MPEFLNSSLGLKFTVPQAVKEIARFMREDVGRAYKITIGTDSARLPGHRADFVTAIVVHRIGNGGRYFWRRIEHSSIHTLRERILREVMISLDVAKGVIAELRACHAATSGGALACPEGVSNEARAVKLPDFDFEIHVDVGERGPTQPMIQEVVAMIRANNFEARTKPESYAASKVADRHV